MFDAIAGAADHGAPSIRQCDPLRAFFDQQQDALLNAAALLGGCGGVKLARAVIEGLADPAVPSQRVLRALHDLRDLLTLEHVHAPDREEAAHFAAIDPADPCVAEICLLADGLCNAIDGYRADQRAAA
jgi:hypothetical protein